MIASSSVPNLVFATTEVLVIPMGYVIGGVTAQCTTPGIIGNGLPAGDLTQIQSWQGQFVVSCTNPNPTSDGADLETDYAYARRIYAITDSFSNAGSYGAYYAFAMGASSDIAQVAVSGPEDGLDPGNVQLNVMLQGGQFPDQAMCDLVLAAVNPDNVRDLCAFVHVKPPSGVPYSTSLTYFIDRTDTNQQVAIDLDVKTAVNQWITNNSLAMGGSINPSLLNKMVLDAGASYCQVDEPAHTLLAKWSVGVLVNDPEVIYGGIEQDIP